MRNIAIAIMAAVAISGSAQSRSGSKPKKERFIGAWHLVSIVGPDGKPRDIKLSRSLGLGLDEKAIQAVNQWKFEPALKDGKPVAVAINVEVQFRLY